MFGLHTYPGMSSLVHPMPTNKENLQQYRGQIQTHRATQCNMPICSGRVVTRNVVLLPKREYMNLADMLHADLNIAICPVEAKRPSAHYWVHISFKNKKGCNMVSFLP